MKKKTKKDIKIKVLANLNDNKYNGWTNYATWRVNLDILGDIDFTTSVLESKDEKWRPCVKYLEQYVNTLVFDKNRLYIENYAKAFLSEINYHEILEHILEEIDNELKTREFL